jgi:sulfite exporter TauE/SafE
MERSIIMAIIKILARVLFFTIIIGGLIAFLGYTNQWTSPIKYSNAFFIAGALMMIAGGMSRLAAGEDWKTYQMLSGESFRGMSSGDRANYIINISSQLSTMLVGILTGIVLFILSAVAAYLF